MIMSTKPKRRGVESIEPSRGGVEEVQQDSPATDIAPDDDEERGPTTSPDAGSIESITKDPLSDIERS
jgi:hypothetical protein